MIPAAPAARSALTDWGAMGLAAAVVAGAWASRPLPVALGVLLVVLALAGRQPLVLVVGAALLASALGANALAGLRGVERRSFTGSVTVVADPVETAFGSKADVRVGQRRLELRASDGASGAVLAALAGERLHVEGSIGPPPANAPWLVPRHVAGVLEARQVELEDAGTPPWAAANRVRRLLARGAEPLPESTRSLFAGFVLGDDRGQPPEVVDDFRGAGLTHVLVVSGQNLAFVLLLAEPLLRRLRWSGRWAVTVSVILAFGLVTRFEPSVLRAAAMAGIAVTAGAAGRPASGARALALAVAALVLIDPLLVRSVGFQLSVAASLAIVTFSSRIAAQIPGPAGLGSALGVTVAAQLGVAPVLVPRFGGLPVVALLANPLAVPVAGFVTSWGLPAGLLAGALGPGVARLVHVPTQAAIGWVAGVARIAAAQPLGELRMPHVVLLTIVVAVLVRGPTGLQPPAVALGLAVLLAPAIALRSPPPVVALPAGGEVRRAGGSTEVWLPARGSVGSVLQDLRRSGVRRIDVLHAGGASPSWLAPMLRALRHRWPVARVVDVRGSP